MLNVPETVLDFGALRKCLFQLLSHLRGCSGIALMAVDENFLNELLCLLLVLLTFP